MAAGDWKRPSGPKTPTGSSGIKSTSSQYRNSRAGGSANKLADSMKSEIYAYDGKKIQDTDVFKNARQSGMSVSEAAGWSKDLADKGATMTGSKAVNNADRSFTTHSGVESKDILKHFDTAYNNNLDANGMLDSEGFEREYKAAQEKYGFNDKEYSMARWGSRMGKADFDRYFTQGGIATRPAGEGMGYHDFMSQPGKTHEDWGVYSRQIARGESPMGLNRFASSDNTPRQAQVNSALPPSSQAATAAATSAPSSNRTAEIQQHIQWLKNDKGLTGDALNQRIYEDAQRYGISANQLTEAMGTSLSGYADYLNRNGLADLPGTNYTGTGDGVVGTGSTSNTTQPQAQQNARDAYYNGNNVPNQTDGGVTGTMFLDGPGSPTAMAAQTETRTVAPEETSQHQLEKMLGSDSQLMQRAEALSNEQMNARGLLNSSMAAEAAQGAMIDAAQPYALNDANTYAKASMDNMTATNQTNLQNASQFNDMLYDNYSSNKDRAFEAGQTDQAQAFDAEQRALDRDFEQAMQGLDNDIKIRLQEMSDTSAMLRQKSAENAELTKTEKTQLAGMYATYMSARSDVMSADLKLEHKNMMISKMDSQFINDIAAYTDLTGFSVPEEFFTNMGASGNTGTGNNGLLGAYYDPAIAAQYVGGAQQYIPGTRNQATKDS